MQGRFFMYYTRDEMLEICGMMLPDQFDQAFMGYAETCGKVVAVYDRDKVIELLDCENEEEATDYFCFNIAGAYLGDTMPVYFSKATLQPQQPAEPPQDPQASS